MIITLQDDGVLRVYQSLEAVVLDVEALDAERVLRTVLDERGQRYVVKWLQPNTEVGIAGPIKVVGSGRYRLVPVGQPDLGALQSIIAKAAAIEPASAEHEVRALGRRLVKG
ncbi:MAG: hypothetical protein IPM35_33635 [Myxococcales bacterium]|nr:hypothetical protein [Myxococcales bacterium]